MATFDERIEALGNEGFLDSIIIAHGFTTYGRDYDVMLLTVAPLPPDVPIGDTTGTYFDARYRYRFTHVPEAHLRSAVEPQWWRESWDDLFIDYESWETAGTPEGSCGARNAPRRIRASLTLLIQSGRQHGRKRLVGRCTRCGSKRTSSCSTSSVTT
jgi:hypothetical protein